MGFRTLLVIIHWFVLAAYAHSDEITVDGLYESKNFSFNISKMNGKMSHTIGDVKQISENYLSNSNGECYLFNEFDLIFPNSKIQNKTISCNGIVARVVSECPGSEGYEIHISERSNLKLRTS